MHQVINGRSMGMNRAQAKKPAATGRTLIAVAAAGALLAAYSSAQAGTLWWDTASTAGLNGGTGDWDAAGGTNWATSASPANGVNPGPWVQGSDAVFTSTSTNTVTISGIVQANSLTQISNSNPSAGTTISGGTLELGAGGYTSSLSNPMVIGSALNLAANQTWNTGTALTVNGIIGQTGGSFGFNKTGNNGLTLTNVNTYTGATTVNYGALTLNGNGSIGTISGLTIAAGGSFVGTAAPLVVLDNTGTNKSGRIAGNVTLGLTGELKINGNASADSTETIGTLGFDSGLGTLTISQNNTGHFSTVAATSLSRANHATALVRSSSLASDARGARISLGTVPSGADFVGAGGAPAGTTTTTNLAIIPWMLAGTSDSSNGTAFATYDTTRNSLRALVAGEMDTLTDSYATTGNNVTLGAVTVNLDTGARTFNSLLVSGAATINGAGTAGDTLTINSGALAFTSGNSTVSGFGKITLGNGEGIVSASANNQIVTINSPIDVTSSGGLTKTGYQTGTVVLGANNLYSGQTTVNSGTLQVGTGGTTGDLGSSSAIVLNGGNITFNRSDDITYGNISGATTNTNGTSGTLTKTGTGKLTLTGTNAIPGALNVTAGGLVINGTTTTGYNNTIGGGAGTFATLTVGGTSGLTAINGNLTIGNGAGRARASVQDTASLTAGGQLNLGSGSGTAGALYQSGGTLTVASPSATTTWFGTSGGYGFYAISGGVLNQGHTIRVGDGAGSRGVVYQSGGDIISGGHLDLNGTNGGAGIYYMTGGTYTTPAGSLNIGYSNGARGELTITNATMNIAGTLTLVNGGSGPDTTGIVNLNQGGILQYTRISSSGTAVGTNTRQINFNGGTLKYDTGATGQVDNSANYTINVFESGATFDVVRSNANPQILQPLLAPAGKGISGTTYTIANGGSGYIGAPVVTIGGATGATAVANMVDDETGNGTFKVASITITSPGINASGTPSLSFAGGGFTTAADSTGVTLATADNASGGLTKKGGGKLTLSSTVNTYTGATTIQGGTLILNAAASIDNSSGVDVWSEATLDLSAKNGYAINGLAGGGTVVGKSGQSLTISNTLAPGHSIDTVTISAGNLALANNAVYDYEIGGTTASPTNDLTNLTGTASTVSFAGNWTLNLANLGTVDPTGKTFTLFDYVGADPSSLGTYAINYGTTGWSDGVVSIDSINKQIVLSGLTAVPEPASLGLLAFGAMGLLARRRRDRA